MSVRVCNGVLSRGPKDGALRYALFMLAHQADDYGFSAAEQDEIAELMAVSPRTVQRSFAELEEQKWMRVERKVLSGRTNIYLIDLQKLGVTVGEKPYRHKLWADIQRLKAALDGGAKVSRMQGVMRFEKPADAAGNVEAGNLFDDVETDDKLSSESDSSARSNEPGRSTLPAETKPAANTGDILTPDTRQNGSPGDNLSPDSRQIVAFPDDKLSPGLSTSKNSHKDSSPLPPNGGAAGLVLPVEDCTIDDPNFGMASGVAARWVMDQLGITKMRLEAVLTASLRLYCQQRRSETLQSAASTAVSNYRLYMTDQELMRFGPWSPAKFFGEGYWSNQQAWPYDREKLQRRREANAGRWSPP